ncbi:hypothetical protein AD428_14800, partial [Achromobacter sp. DMS1]
MKISRFVGANSREVMRLVRQALGPDALIVSNRSVEGGVEVLATADGAFDEPAADMAQGQGQAQGHAHGQGHAAVASTAPGAADGWG